MGYGAGGVRRGVGGEAVTKVTGVVFHACSKDGGRRWISVAVHRGRDYCKYYYHVSKASQLRLLRALGGWQS